MIHLIAANGIILVYDYPQKNDIYINLYLIDGQK